MRLTNEEQNAIRKVIHQADPQAQIWLFGSRANDQAKGGDIDLLILSKTLGLKDRAGIRLALYDLIGEQKIDLVIAADDTDPFTRIALAEGIRL
ncbi:nucleotidyltransferase domain-containing protein [Endozoicomonas sp. GU-1]|uniref:nucleotidyltransferase family protein n=1 Tax=Endozoicomonas sp. GU-1 TaxID=3009078 RepID=UPI0022B44E88|nr:nucleotidyltransferase domain-containing protein [Endozoicomonas sp. GU-1]WBA79657.1 nucleotidyltransferase domain-containing protein [Endozoicomonas sp. GU-1]WBA87240.1 nucleotidyltransferase domain-containing protein [Endozoicomonas sp. GU-1]